MAVMILDDEAGIVRVFDGPRRREAVLVSGAPVIVPQQFGIDLTFNSETHEMLSVIPVVIFGITGPLPAKFFAPAQVHEVDVDDQTPKPKNLSLAQFCALPVLKVKIEVYRNREGPRTSGLNNRVITEMYYTGVGRTRRHHPSNRITQMQAICKSGGPSVILKSDACNHAIFPRQPCQNSGSVSSILWNVSFNGGQFRSSHCENRLFKPERGLCAQISGLTGLLGGFSGNAGSFVSPQ